MPTVSRPLHRALHCLIGILFCLITANRAAAHPLSQGSLNVVIHDDHLDVTARVTLEEVSVTTMLVTQDPLRPPVSAGSDEAFDEHARYLVSHLRFTTDGKPLVGRVVHATPPNPADGANAQRAVYALEYRLPDGAKWTGASRLQLTHTALTDVTFIGGVKWEATYVVQIGQVNRTASQGLLLEAGKPLTVDLNWGAANETAGGGGATIDRARMFREYLHHGVWHILQGYDHLLFITALVLATSRLWDLLKVVTAFTIAHTITLALAAMAWVNVSPRIVEPMIAASIVFVAVQNVFWPRRSRGWGRLAAAFFFGLFHGLGFAGGLLEAMQQMPVTSKLLAIASFSLGVEIGHQMIVLPVFGALKIARKTRDTDAAKERVSLLAQRFGSAAVSLAGMFYLVVALRESFSI